MKKVIKAAQPVDSKSFLVQEKSQVLKAFDEACYHLDNMMTASGGDLFENIKQVYGKTERLYTAVEEIFEEFYGVDASCDIEAAADDLPKGYYDDYYGQSAYEEYGDLVSEKCSGMVISKRASDGEEPGGLIYEAERLGIDDFFDLLKCLEGMCYNGAAIEISDYQYKVY